MNKLQRKQEIPLKELVVLSKKIVKEIGYLDEKVLKKEIFEKNYSLSNIMLCRVNKYVEDKCESKIKVEVNKNLIYFVKYTK